MALLADILVWTTTNLLPWQRDALRRLFQQTELSTQDFDDLYAMMKSAQGLPDAKDRQPVPLAKEHLPADPSTSEPVILKAVRDLKNVNRIAEGQQLDFAPKGITVIYGGNASGKSGYVRVLKHACRARDRLETIHPDANDPGASKRIPEAIFDIETGGHSKSLNWKRDVEPPTELSTIAVFDTRCARAYLDEQDIAYVPYGLDIVQNLVQQVLPELSKRLDREIASINTDTSPFADLQDDTTVGRLIASLGQSTRPEDVTKLAQLTDEKKKRLAALNEALAEKDPKAKAKECRLSRQRFNELISRIDTAFGYVNDSATEQLKFCDQKAETAIEAEKVAAERFRTAEPLLPGTGEDVWKKLFESARRFSLEAAYPDKPFPYIEPGAKCPLCQQPLAQEAAKRMHSFDEFVKDDTARVAAEKRQQRTAEQDKVKNISLDFGLEEAMTEEIKQLDPSLLENTQKFQKRIKDRRTWMLGALQTHAWDGPPLFDEDPRDGLKHLSEKLLAQADELDKVGDASNRKELETEQKEFRSRHNLSVRLDSVLVLINRMQVKDKLEKCKSALKTKTISEKAKEFASQIVTEALERGLNEEFHALGIGHIKTKLVKRGVKGEMKHKLVLDLPVATKLQEILSEGEQRAIAIGSFLAELHLADHRGGIIFDDPVSSLDHHRRKQVAYRLVEEARRRQVIVLTHETVFLCELLDAIDQRKVDAHVSHLEWLNNRPGHVLEGLPWEHMDYKERLSKLDEEQKRLKTIWSAYPNPEDRTRMQRQYSLLRATIERIVQDVVFNGVLHRYRDRISIDRLNDVVGFTQSEFREIKRLYKVCCEAIDSHDSSSIKNSPVPSAEQLDIDIKAVRGLVKEVKDRRAKVVEPESGESS